MSDQEEKKKPDEEKVTLAQLKALPKESMAQLAYDTVAALLDSDAEIVRVAGYNDEELLNIFNKASSCHNRIAAAKAMLEKIDHQKNTEDVFWMVWTMKLEARLRSAENEMTRLAQTVNTRALLRNGGGMR